MALYVGQYLTKLEYVGQYSTKLELMALYVRQYLMIIIVHRSSCIRRTCIYKNTSSLVITKDDF